jgi:hypothetical protein
LKVIKNRRSEAKKVIIMACLGFILIFSTKQSAEAIGLPILAIPILKVDSDYNQKYKITPICQNKSRVNQISHFPLLPTNGILPFIYLNQSHFYINDDLLKRLRGGDLPVSVVLITLGAVIMIVCYYSGVDAFSIAQDIGVYNAPSPNPDH